MRFFTILLALMLFGLLLHAQAGNPCPGEPAVTYEGQVYNTVLVGDKCWLKENLNVGVMILSDVDQTNNGILEKYCYDDLPENCEVFGGLYQWGELMQYDLTPGSRGICPVGWRIPTDDEWKMLEGALDSQFDFDDPQWDNFNFRGFDAGKNIKSSLGWMYDGNGEDELGISVLPGGHRDFCGTYYTEGFANYQWTSTVYDDKTAWYRIITSNSDLIGRRYAHKDMGASVRCIKDITLTYTLALEVSPAEAGTVEGGGEYEEGEEINITATANQGWEFLNWTDSEGVVVSEEESFLFTMPAYDIVLTANFNETTPGFTCGNPFTDERDGNIYSSVFIGDQCWMAENLKYLPSVVGPGTGSQTTPYYYVTGYNGTDVRTAKSQPNYATYGVLYNWPAAMAGSASSSSNPSGVQGACPSGWHLPSDTEWAQLTNYLGGLSVAGGKLKETGTTHWASPNTGATNETGFTALPGGYRFGFGAFEYIGTYGYWWSATEYSATSAWERSMFYNSSNVGRAVYGKDYGFSVRCVRD